MPRLDLEAHRRHLLEHGAELVGAALTGAPDAAIPGLAVRVDAVHYRPGRDVTVGYVAELGDGDTRQEEYVLATTADVSGGVVTLDSEEFSFRVWQHPHDPVLRSAPVAFDPGAVAGWLGTAGLASGEVALTAVAYRPMRRAVLRAEADGGRWFVKVQRPKRHLEYLERMALLAPAGITPPVVASTRLPSRPNLRSWRRLMPLPADRLLFIIIVALCQDRGISGSAGGAAVSAAACHRAGRAPGWRSGAACAVPPWLC